MSHPPRDQHGERRASLSFPVALDSPTHARRFTFDLLETWQLDDAVASAELVVSELVRNAVEHAGTECVLTLVATPGCLRIEVADADPTLPVRRHPTAMDLTGRGLVLVDAVADHWGASRRGAGKVVFCELSLTEPARSADRARGSPA